jgi:hypothetical protein
MLQHATVTVVAIGALGVVVRRVLGVFERRPVGPAAPSPGCSHCASGTRKG